MVTNNAASDLTVLEFLLTAACNELTHTPPPHSRLVSA
jgi:hypothetical protein